MKNKLDLKICGVCGDKALGYNFNAVTCESCKAFFRRNALIPKEFRCPFTNDCKITTVTRRFCQKCRLDKCFSIGMCKDLIMSEEDKAQKRQKIEENRAKKRITTNSNSEGSKKVKKESVEADSQDSELYPSSYCTDSDQDTSISEGYQPNNPNIAIHQAKTINDDHITSTNDRQGSSIEDSLLTFQNITEHLYNLAANHSGRNLNQLDPALLNCFMNNNTLNFNDFMVKSETAPVSSPAVQQVEDVSSDVVRDVQR